MTEIWAVAHPAHPTTYRDTKQEALALVDAWTTERFGRRVLANDRGGSMSEHTDTDRQRVERVIREALPSLLVSEYGETEADWCELRSIHRIAADLAARIVPATQTPDRPSAKEQP